MRNIKCFIIMLSTIFFVHNVSYAYQNIGLENFDKENTYKNQFTDVGESEWFYSNVKEVYSYGLMNGNSNTTFNPLGNITVAESITLLARINCIYTYGTPIFGELIDDDVWYSPYVQYAEEHELIKEYGNYNISATRAEFAKILATSIDPVDFEEINLVDDGAIPDVSIDADYAEAVYLLYRAGVLTGSDANGTFNPNSTITRAEAAAIVTRIVDPSLRKSIELTGEY